MNRLNLGCGKNPRAGWVNIDRYDTPGVDNICDLNKESIPYPDATFDYILASHILEHIPDFTHIWREIHRVLKVNGFLEVEVPYGPNADPFHARSFTEESIFWLLLPFEHRNLDRDSWWNMIDTEIRYEWKSWVPLHIRYSFDRCNTVSQFTSFLTLIETPLRRKKFLWFILQKVN